MNGAKVWCDERFKDKIGIDGGCVLESSLTLAFFLVFMCFLLTYRGILWYPICSRSVDETKKVKSSVIFIYRHQMTGTPCKMGI